MHVLISYIIKLLHFNQNFQTQPQQKKKFNWLKKLFKKIVFT
jgi:hypothetical protein